MRRSKSSHRSLWSLPGIALLCMVIAACEKEENMSTAPQVDMTMIPVTDTLPPIIAENTLLTNTHTWYIEGWVSVSNEATLIIEPGAIIKIVKKRDTGGGLVITRGAKIIASGLSNWPIHFQLNGAANATSNRWSGIILLGRAPQTKPYSSLDDITSARSSGGWAYGGNKSDDSSGVLKHVRITTAFPEGLLLLGVGSKTLIQDIVIDK